MKVLHISINDSSGAGTAALRLHLGLLSIGVNSKFLCLNKQTSYPEVYKFDISTKISIYTTLKRKLKITTTQAQRNNKLIEDLAGELEYFSFPLTDYKVHEHHLVQEADVINLHWISNFINFPTFFKSLKKPFVWTLHDMNPFQGGFHYENDRINNWALWKNVELKLEKVKEESIKEANKLIVVTPSRWLADASAKSSVLGSFPTYTYAYGLDQRIFRPLSKSFCCEALNIPSDVPNLFFIAESLNNYRKGFDLLLEALTLLKSNHKFNVITVGKINDNNIGVDFNFYNLGNISDPRLLSLAYNASDVFILPSREDNLPNVMLEAFSCGIPVISLPVGGMAEMIIDGVNGILCTNKTSGSLSEAIGKYLDKRYLFKREEIRKFAVDNFSLDQQARKYIELYSSVLECE